MLIGQNQKLLMIGDSITDCERTKPVGEGLFQAQGRGYVGFVDGLLQAVYPDRKVRVVNMGCGGHTIRDLAARWQTDVLDQKPDWLSIMIGINDVWRQFDAPLQPEWSVPLAEYEATLDALVRQAKPGLQGLVLLTPYHLEANREDAMRHRMDEYSGAVKRVAKAHGAILVDTQAAFDAVLRHYHNAYLAWDRVHPVVPGHMVIARAFLQGLGFDWNRTVP